jgi:hypothetical protein
MSQFVHYTTAKAAEAIKTEGLRPSLAPRDYHPGFDHGAWPSVVVWLTTSRTPYAWWRDPGMYARAIVVAIPTCDRRLISFPRWLRENYGPEDFSELAHSIDNAVGGVWRDHWLYMGRVPPERIKAILPVRLVDKKTGEEIVLENSEEGGPKDGRR